MGREYPKFPRRRFVQRGNALISALAMVTVCTLMLSGVCVLASAHASRQRREADYALALNLAEAGINYELWYVNTHSGTSAHTDPNNPFDSSTSLRNQSDGVINGTSRLFTVYATKQDGTTWTAGSAMRIVSTGKVLREDGGYITRTVAVNCSGGGTTGGTKLFDSSFTVFGIQRLLFLGGSSSITGAIGADGPPPSGVPYSIDAQSNGGANVNGSGINGSKPLVLAGGATMVGGNAINPNFVNNANQINQKPQPIFWPTIDTIVQGTFTNGWSDLSSTAAVNAQWARIRTFSTNSPNLTIAGTRPCTPPSSNLTVLSDSILKSQISSGQAVNALILPPGDYYFTQIDLQGSGYNGSEPTLYLDTAAQTVSGGTPGPVRIWINGTATSPQDNLLIRVVYTGSSTVNPSRSRIYYNKPNTFNIWGNGTIYGGVYAVRKGLNSTGSSATLVLGSQGRSVNINGMTIGDYVTFGGGINVLLPVNDMSDSGDYLVGGTSGGTYGFSDTWEEWADSLTKAKTGKAIFSDGTNQ